MDEKERQKELVRQLGEEAAAKQKQIRLDVEKKADEGMARILEIIKDTQKLVEQWSDITIEEERPKKPDLRLVPPISSETPVQDTKKEELDE
ncbi:hypothetical protein [Enterococcus termitis]|jgi:hypothetical protein|uniref:Uncharacterized protein n=1 Tax=Enterococcus termitis TaxID=332950 RepID=A0A1E5H1W5_9ENTE|nr:hypothetical protein [Enterococcus termitis]OEG18929.1 hypothetical protein BCR25_15155 [Enterococcus termitis]OJG97359.1 hypothetical protein RV18_GL000851 [Enterococcus termitis]